MFLYSVEAGSPMADVAHYFTISAQFDAGEKQHSLSDLRSLRRRIPENHIALRAQVDWELGTILASSGNAYDGLEAYNRALWGFERLKESEFIARMRTLCARTLNLLGDPSEAWKVRREALAIASQSGDDRSLEFVLGEAALDELLQRRWDSARALQGVAIRSVPPANPRRRLDIVLWRALITQPIDLGPAERAFAALSDPGLKADAENDLRFARAIVGREHQPAQAVALLSDCIAFSERTRKTAMLPYLYLERARTHLRAHDADAAAEDLGRSIALFEARRTTIVRRDLRDAFVGTVDGAFEELLEIMVRRKQHDEAFALGERRRGRIFLDSIGRSSSHAVLPLDANEIARRVPEDARVFVFTAARNHVLATVLDRGGHLTRQLPGSVEELRESASALRTALEAGADDEASPIARRLYESLIATVARGRGRVSTLIIVADTPLKDIPFAFLRTDDGRFLIDEAAIVRATSASAYVHSLRLTAAVRERGTLLAVGDPAFDRRRFPDLPPLAHASLEAAEIGAMYPRTTTLNGRAATFRKFESGTATADVIHIAAHAIANSDDAALSQLLFASDADESGACSLKRISDMHLKHGSIVVLAGCRTAVGDRGFGGLRDFAGAFLAAGATNAVATLWDAEDATTRTFAGLFHRELRSGVRPADALRRAQLAMLRSNDPSVRSGRAWSGFQIYGNGN